MVSSIGTETYEETKKNLKRARITGGQAKQTIV